MTAVHSTPAPKSISGQRPASADSIDDALSVFLSVRPRLFGIAYRILGSAADAEDIVQSAWLRWQMKDRSAVRDAPAFLTTTAVRLAVNLAQSAHARRESYVGPWLPEPVDTSLDPCLGAECDDALELAVLMLLEKLSPNERAAYVLREAFDYPHRQIAEILKLTEVNVRQLITRARRHISAERRAPASPTEHKRLLTAFISAAQEGNVIELEGLFAPDVASYADGGGIMNAARIPVVGRSLVAKYVARIAAPFWGGLSLKLIDANGRASLAMLRGNELIALATITASRRHINQIMWVMRPSKLTAISRSSSLYPSRAPSARRPRPPVEAASSPELLCARARAGARNLFRKSASQTRSLPGLCGCRGSRSHVSDPAGRCDRESSQGDTLCRPSPPRTGPRSSTRTGVPSRHSHSCSITAGR
jgi:RNA polymerase sigma-70 factor (ECF subfamily)